MIRTTTGAVCLSLTLACTGQLDETASPPGTGPGATGPAGIAPVGTPPVEPSDPTPSSGGQSSDPGPVVSSPTDCSGGITDIDITPLRRLTNADYLNTVTDLVGDVSSLNLAFAVEVTTEHFPFLNNAGAQQTPPELALAYMNAAERIASDAVTNRLSTILTCDPVVVGEQACATTFISSFAGKAFRRPLDADQTQALASIWQVGRDTGGEFKSGVEAVIMAVLQMPEFLYRFEMTPPVAGQGLVPLDGWDMATRLSYLLWNSGPDDDLLAAAQAGTLQTPEEISAQVTRMLSLPRAHEMVLSFHDQWLRLANIASLEKDPTQYPAFSPAVATAMQQEVRSIVDAVIFQGDGKIGGLFTAPFTFMNDVLGEFYGVSGLGPTFARVDQTMLGMRPAAGILTAGGLLAAHANRNITSPTKRGIFVRAELLCQDLPPPPQNANIVPPVQQPNQTRREAMIAHVADPTCAGCHQLMDPVGFGFEGFDASGAWRTTDSDQPIDSSGSIVGSDVAGAFNGPLELGSKLAGSDDAVSCAATQWFRFAFGRHPGATTGDGCAVTALHDALAQGGTLALVRAIPQTVPFLYRKVPEGGL